MKKTLPTIASIALYGCLLSSCSDTPEQSLYQKASSIDHGMKKAQVIDMLGIPGNRNFQGKREVLQYCENVLKSERFVTIYLKNDIVKGMLNNDVGFSNGNCSNFEPIDWNKFKDLDDDTPSEKPTENK